MNRDIKPNWGCLVSIAGCVAFWIIVMMCFGCATIKPKAKLIPLSIRVVTQEQFDKHPCTIDAGFQGKPGWAWYSAETNTGYILVVERWDKVREHEVLHILNQSLGRQGHWW